MFASFYYCESNRIPIVSCLRCAVEKTEGRDVSERCERPVVEREGGNWKVREVREGGGENNDRPKGSERGFRDCLMTVLLLHD